MEEIHLPASASCENELTRSNSHSDSDSESSSLTTENSKDILQHKGNTRPGQCTAWTNEKHNQYLNSLEASFVKQLHRSMGCLAWCSEQSKDARNVAMKQPAKTASEQFTVLRDGCWQKINYGKTTNVGSHDFLRSTSVKNLKRADRPCSTRLADLHECCKIQKVENLLTEQKTSSHRVERCPEDLPVNYTYYCDSVGSDTESSGQNFMDEDCEDDSRHWIKKLKTAVADTSSGDQTVPSVTVFAKSNSAVGDMPLEEQARHKSPLEDYQVCDYSQSGLESFLSGGGCIHKQ